MQGHIVYKPNQVVSSTISSSAAALDDAETDTVAAIITIETNDVRMRFDGTDPTSGVGGGMLMKADSVWEVVGRDVLQAMKFIAESSDAHVTRSELAGE